MTKKRTLLIILFIYILHMFGESQLKIIRKI